MKKESKEEKIKEDKTKKGKVKKEGNKKKHTFLKVILILLFIIIIVAVIFAIKVHQNGGGLQGVLKTSLGHDNNTVEQLDKIYCLLLGQSENLTDTIMLASYDPKTQEAALLSIPRDTFIGQDKNYAEAVDKINAVYQFGVDGLLEDVRNLTGINVQYYLKVDTEALKVLVDEIGGVYFDVPIDMHYTDRRQGLYIDLKAGYQLLDGDKAEQVVRFRHNSDGTTYPYEYGGEDLGRMRTQREFLTALLEQTIENMDISTIFGFLDIAEKYVETNLNFDAIKDYVPYILDFDIDDLKTATLPGISEQSPGTGIWIYTPYEDEVEETINELFYGVEPEDDTNSNTIDGNTVSESETNENSNINIEVLNGSGNSNNLSEVVAKLEAQGYEVTQTGNTSNTNNTTIINRSNISETELSKIKEILHIDNVTSGDSESSQGITIILGTDYVM